MRRSASTGERIWRAIALGLFVALAWQLGNAALAPPMAAPVVDEPVVEAPLLEPPASAAILPATDEAPAQAPTAPAPHESIPAPQAAVRIGNTGGIGAYLRATPRLADRLRAWPDGTVLIPTGQQTEAEGRQWRQVVDPAGGVGWIPAAYLVP